MEENTRVGPSLLATTVEGVPEEMVQRSQAWRLCLMIMPNMPRGQWPLGRVIEAYKGKDDNVTTYIE